MINEKLCDLSYLSGMMGGKSPIILQMIDAFLKQSPEELHAINEAVANSDLVAIKSYAHSMRSSISIMGISVLTPILQEMENLAAADGDAERMAELSMELNANCTMALIELQQLKHDYI